MRIVKVGRRETVRRGLKSRRATVGLSQLAVAERLGITEKRYWRIENGYDDPTPEQRDKLARLFKVTEEAMSACFLLPQDSELPAPASQRQTSTQPTDLSTDAVRTGR